MRRIYLIVSGLIITLIISGFLFSSVSRSGEQGDQFYSYMKSGDFEKILEIIDQEALKNRSKLERLQILKSRTADWGNLISYKNTGFHTETINGKNITKLDYTIVNSNGEIFEHLDFIKRGSNYKILSYSYISGNKLVNK